MIYFKTETIDFAEGKKVEAALRHYAARRHTSLDLRSSSHEWYIPTEELFIGQEDEQSIKFTRMRSSFERIFPKLIIRFDKKADFTHYKIRYSLLSTIVVIFLAIVFTLNLGYWIATGEADGLSGVGLLSMVFFVLTIAELYFTKRSIKKAISRFS